MSAIYRFINIWRLVSLIKAPASVISYSIKFRVQFLFVRNAQVLEWLTWYYITDWLKSVSLLKRSAEKRSKTIKKVGIVLSTSRVEVACCKSYITIEKMYVITVTLPCRGIQSVPVLYRYSLPSPRFECSLHAHSPTNNNKCTVQVEPVSLAPPYLFTQLAHTHTNKQKSRP